MQTRAEDNRLVISSQRKPRQGWEEALRSAGAATEDELLLQSDLDDDFDREEWTW